MMIRQKVGGLAVFDIKIGFNTSTGKLRRLLLERENRKLFLNHMRGFVTIEKLSIKI